MKVSFDGLRRHIAEDFNALIGELHYQNPELKQETNCDKLITNLRGSLGALMACYDSNEEDDFNDLSEEIKLLKL